MEDKYLTEVNNTISYYEENADDFIALTVNADMSKLYKNFEKFLKPEARILDLGSGSGRDSKYFSEKGYDVVAIDASPAMCESTKQIAHVPVYLMAAEDMKFQDEFDAVWACASLLHVEKKNMAEVIERIIHALKPEGVAYMSWKYGEKEHNDGLRYYADFTESSISKLLNSLREIETINIWTTGDNLPGREDLKWLNILVKKQLAKS